MKEERVRLFCDTALVRRLVDSPVTLAVGLGREGPVSAGDLDCVEEFENALVRSLVSDDRFGAPAPWVSVREVGDEDVVLWAPFIAWAFSSATPEAPVSAVDLTPAHVALAIDDATAFLGDDESFVPPRATGVLGCPGVRRARPRGSICRSR